jgi:ABC-2 type transport system ATP-binding protein
MSVVVSQLTKVFGKQKAIDNISFEAKKGEIIGFLGPNGAGKSTTMKIATCYIPPTSGTVNVCGYDIHSSPIEVRRKIGYLPEHNPLYVDMHVHEYLKFIGNLHGLKGKALKDRSDMMIGMCGLTQEQNKLISSLSKGYRQRVGLAQALIHDPEVLILDEPTTGLDPNQLVEIRNLIRQVSQDKTVIFSTHIMQEVQALCSRVVVINQGAIVANDPLEALQTGNTKITKVTVEFSSSIDIELLRAVDGVNKVNQLSETKYALFSDKDEDIRQAVFQLAAKEGIPLIGINLEEESIEQVFQQLTKPTD